MEMEIGKLQKKLEEKNEQLQVSNSSAEKVSISYTVPYYFFSWFMNISWSYTAV